MTTQEADRMLERISDMAWDIEHDEELRELDPRYAITAKWIDTDIDNTDL